MTELKLSTAAEAAKPVEKIVEEIKAPVVEAPRTDGLNTTKPADIPKVVTTG